MRKTDGIELVETILTPDMLKKLSMLAGLDEADIQITDRGFKFQFENSLRANQCRVIRYHNNVIIEFRKQTDNLLEGKSDSLIYEDVIKPENFQEVFEKQTGIYLSALDY
jgi:hypothetical protein